MVPAAPSEPPTASFRSLAAHGVSTDGAGDEGADVEGAAEAGAVTVTVTVVAGAAVLPEPHAVASRATEIRQDVTVSRRIRRADGLMAIVPFHGADGSVLRAFGSGCVIGATSARDQRPHCRSFISPGFRPAHACRRLNGLACTEQNLK